MFRFFECCRKKKANFAFPLVEIKEENWLPLDEDKKNHYRNLPEADQVSAAGRQILPAIKWQEHPREFKIENLNEDELESIARSTNCASWHYTANCPILSVAFLYNLKRGKTELSIDNVHPVYKPTHSGTASEIVFGQSLTLETYKEKGTAKELIQKILDIYKNTEERVFFISVTFLKKFKVGHCFNAVVLGKDENIRVVFVDVWKTLQKTVNSSAEFQKSYSRQYEMLLFTSPKVVHCLKKPVLSKVTNHPLKTLML